ncbi:MAG: arginine deiminase-related protein [Imperialibacter sp.]|uniref:citrulline utilization hydrolase CtlX n=1 Tax=Imperialibacter sp. TaxID=2038411 RepID=UPI0032EF5314
MPREIKLQSNAAPAVLMVRPANFGPNPETAGSNSFQSAAQTGELDQIRLQSIAEFDAAVDTLRNGGVEVIVAQDTFLEERRDAVFPNNWVSFHESGDVFLYPMQSKARRTERRPEVIDAVKPRFTVHKITDLSGTEEKELYLEGTGSLIVDYPNRIMYASRSIRTNEGLVRAHATRLGFRAVVFDAVDRSGMPIYHTNVMMCLGTSYCVVCLESIPEGEEKRIFLASLATTSHEIVDISFDQMEHFAGNMLEVATSRSKPALVMSITAFTSLTQSQKIILEKYANLIAVDIPTIEKYGGGSARCMMAGIHLPAI